jgi:hypothetical protein
MNQVRQLAAQIDHHTSCCPSDRGRVYSAFLPWLQRTNSLDI